MKNKLLWRCWAATLFMVLIALGVNVYNRLWIHMEDSPESYDFPVSSMTVYDEMDEPLVNVKSLFFSNAYYDVSDGYTEDPDGTAIHIAHNIRFGDSWDTFVEKYRDYKVYESSVSYYEPQGSGYAYQYSVFFPENITIGELDTLMKEEVDWSCLLDINLTFRVTYLENTVYYDIEDYYDALMEENESLRHLFYHPRNGTFYFDLLFTQGIPYEPVDNGLVSVTISRYRE